MNKLFIFHYVVLTFFIWCIPLESQSQSCCTGGSDFSVILSGSCPRILPSSGTARSGPYAIDRIRDTEGAVIELLNGDLLAVWSKFTNQGRDESAGWLVGRRSSDGGHSWEKEFPVSGVMGMQNSFSPSFLRLSNHDILLFVLAKHDHYEEDILVMKSTDDGQTWDCPIEINAGLQQAYHVMNNDRVIQLTFGPDSGRIICPVAFSSDVTKSGGSNSTYYFKCVTFYSDDNGATWLKGNELVAPNGYIRGILEPAIVEKVNGDLIMLMRTRNGHFLKSISTDGGINWAGGSGIVPLKESLIGANIATPEAPCSIKRIPCTGDLLLIYSDGGAPGREKLVYRLSSDDGDTWGPIQVLEDGTTFDLQYSYTSITFVDDRVLLTYYVHTPQVYSSIDNPSVPPGSTIKIQTIEQKFRSIPIGWFYCNSPIAGNDITSCWQTSIISLQAQLATCGTGQWTVISGTNFWISNPTDPNAQFTGANQIYTLEWEVDYGNGCIVTDQVIVDMTQCSGESVEEEISQLFQENKMKPSFLFSQKGIIISNIDNGILPMNIVIYDINGRFILEEKLRSLKGNHEIRFNNKRVPKGVYIVKFFSNIEGKTNVYAKKILVGQ